MRDNSKILGALVLGAAAGAVLGLLFAPGAGKETREKIKDNAEDLIDELEEKINEGKQTLADISERIFGKAEDIKSKFEEEAQAHKNGDGRKTRHSEAL